MGTCSNVNGQPRGERALCGGSPSCDIGDFTPAPECNGQGACAPPAAIDCHSFVCDGDGCLDTCESDDDCSSDSYCLVATQQCVEKRSIGSSCKGSNECGAQAPNCVDGVCCESACDGQCESCGEAASLGSCVNVQGRPRGGRPTCVGDAVCNGISFTPPFECNGQGACEAPQPEDCGGGYKCNDQGCLGSCSSDAECDTDSSFHCDAALGDCQPTDTAECSDDLTMAIPITGEAENCGAYLCDRSSGTCRSECSSIDDCASGSICDANRTCVPESVSSAGAADGSCGCRVSGDPTQRSHQALALALVGLALLRRRRIPRPRSGKIDYRTRPASGAVFRRR